MLIKNLVAEPQEISPTELQYFQKKLQKWRAELKAKIMAEEGEVHSGLGKEADHIDAAAVARNLEESTIPMINYNKNLLLEINHALERIKDGSYGYCEITGEPIGLARLEAWPIARLSIKAQEEIEKT